MQKRTRYGYQGTPEDGQEAARPRRKKEAPPIMPALILIVLVVIAIAFARTLGGDTERAAAATVEEPTGRKPFASVPDEEPPPPRAGARERRHYPSPPANLAASSPAWGEAIEVARRADELFDAAQKAKAADDHAAFQERGKAAKEAYDEAILLTAAWEEELLEKYGDRDPQMRDILRVRKRWIDRLIVLHKTTGR